MLHALVARLVLLVCRFACSLLVCAILMGHRTKLNSR